MIQRGSFLSPPYIHDTCYSSWMLWNLQMSPMFLFLLNVCFLIYSDPYKIYHLSYFWTSCPFVRSDWELFRYLQWNWNFSYLSCHVCWSVGAHLSAGVLPNKMILFGILQPSSWLISLAIKAKWCQQSCWTIQCPCHLVHRLSQALRLLRWIALIIVTDAIVASARHRIFDGVCPMAFAHKKSCSSLPAFPMV